MRTNKQTSTVFNASEWIAHNTLGGTKISSEAQEVVSSFTTMWNFFESTLCENSASLKAFEVLSCERFDPNRIKPQTIQALDECLSFWNFRYRTPEGFNHLFESLYFRPNDKRAYLASVLE